MLSNLTNCSKSLHPKSEIRTRGQPDRTPTANLLPPADPGDGGQSVDTARALDGIPDPTPAVVIPHSEFGRFDHDYSSRPPALLTKSPSPRITQQDYGLPTSVPILPVLKPSQVDTYCAPEATGFGTQHGNNSVSFFHGAHNFTTNNSNIFGINGSDNVINNYLNSTKTGLRDFLPYICSGAAVDSGERDPPPLCHPGTRKEIQSRLLTWFDDPKRQWSVVWVTGPAGTGKSAVAQSFAERCIKKGRLGAAFFFSRSNKRDKPSTVIPTLAYQMAVRFPDYRALLMERVISDPTILEKTRRIQFMELIIEPISTLQVQGHPITQNPLLILLDGLDECHGTTVQCEFVEMIGEVVWSKKNFPLLWLICARPEPHLKRILLRPDFATECHKEELLLDAKTRNDVDLFLCDGFARLRTEFPDVTDSSWPPSDQFNKISEICSGLFILAATIMKYLGDPEYADPMARLNSVLEFMRDSRRVGIKNPLESLDLFYSFILADIPDEIFPMTKRILSRHLILRSAHNGTFPVQTLCKLLNIDQTAFHVALRKLHSVIDVPPPKDIRGSHLRFYHASFEDYLSNPIRSGKFAIDLNEARAIVHLCPLKYKADRVGSDSLGESAQTPEDTTHFLRTRIPHSVDRYNIFLGMKGINAQRILNILQKLLSSHLDDDAARQSTLIVFLRLSATSGLFPRLRTLHNIEVSEGVGGAFATIFRGQYHGSRVCLKVVRLRQGSGHSPFPNAFQEAVIWSQLVHPNVLPFYGICRLFDGQHQIGLVSPWMTNGDLPRYLGAHPRALRLPLVHDVLAGLQYLHRHQIVHGDLKGANILIKDNCSACLTGFRTSSVFGADGLVQTLFEDDMARWCAPEILNDSEERSWHQSFPSDVYAMASIMFEIFTGKIPFHELQINARVLLRKSRGDTLVRPSHEMAPELTDHMWAIMEGCWSLTPDDRPTVDKVRERLSRDMPTQPQARPVV